ncbi:hypothetical protein BGW36DRAFT_384234 [Talaromyces proteolyticus]|uniref:ATPase AAA-type core domain-containing protein n=1 Tax=Talaromyces proteolyticus TaxID=1131652 RepID=A0AAD4KLV4_9EURO|nr:uncharacterized protein BGW36DRAFT_384234 [Talaromyces proteolyticus]KAH8694041.1 hypothetical protein BGW36DRAFT_384234 [Talaromyces proteolyticus]
MAPQTPIHNGPRVQLTLGPCLFNGMFECPCKAGSIIDTLPSLGLESHCAVCGHAVSLHRELESRSPEMFFKTEMEDTLRPTLEGSASSYTEPTTSQNEMQLTRSRSLIDCPSSRNPLASSTHRKRSLQEVLEESRRPYDEPARPDKRLRSSQTEIAATESTVEDAYVCPRQDTVSTLAKLLEDNGAILIWGMPGSGKSTLGRLLTEHFTRQNKKAVFISDWPLEKPSKLEEILTDFLHTDFPEMSLDDDCVFVIDEAQKTLQKSKRYWNILIKNEIAKPNGSKFCILSGQGQLAGINSVFKDLPEISHLTSHGGCKENVGIFYTQSEFQDVASRLTSKNFSYRLSEDALSCVFSLTAGHPVTAKEILSYIEQFHSSSSTPRRRLKRLVSTESTLEILKDDARLFGYLGDKVYPGAFARKSNIAIKVFQRLLFAPDVKITWNSEFNTIGKCFENGIICHEIDENNKDVFNFPSPLHQRWARWYHEIEDPVYRGELTPELG